KITDINEDHIQDFSNGQGVGVGRLRDVEKKIEEIRYSRTLRSFVESVDELRANVRSYVSGIKIADLFADSKFVLLREYCEANQLIHIDELTDAHLQRISKLPGVGKKKHGEILEILESYETTDLHTQSIDFSGCELYEIIRE